MRDKFSGLKMTNSVKVFSKGLLLGMQRVSNFGGDTPMKSYTRCTPAATLPGKSRVFAGPINYGFLFTEWL